jgi:hypothetical protein
MDGTEHDIFPGRIYALDKHDTHWLLGGEDEDLRLVCMFTPALTGDEAHRISESGIHPSVYGEVVAGGEVVADEEVVAGS